MICLYFSIFLTGYSLFTANHCCFVLFCFYYVIKTKTLRMLTSSERIAKCAARECREYSCCSEWLTHVVCLQVCEHWRETKVTFWLLRNTRSDVSALPFCKIKPIYTLLHATTTACRWPRTRTRGGKNLESTNSTLKSVYRFRLKLFAKINICQNSCRNFPC